MTSFNLQLASWCPLEGFRRWALDHRHLILIAYRTNAQPTETTVLIRKLCYVVGRVDPFFAEAARSAEISRHLNSAKPSWSGSNVISRTKGADCA
jgi:hypothetical protein